MGGRVGERDGTDFTRTHYPYIDSLCAAEPESR
jgi:hypothetical protein